MFDMLVKFMMGLIIFMVVSFIGITIAAQVAETAPLPDLGQIVSDAVPWIAIVIVTVAAIMIFGLLFAVFGPGDSSPPARTTRPSAPQPPARSPERLYWDPYQQRVSPVLVPPGTAAPSPVATTAPTTDELVAHDPEVVARQQEITAGDAAIAALRTERERQNAERGLIDRVIRWARRRSARREGA
jgi:hypothetical protein